jgi:hypothetical protein
VKADRYSVRKVLAVLALASLPGVTFAACASGDQPSEEPGPEDTTQPPQDDPTGGICLMNNCHSDEECLGCADNRTTCLEAENRCVACDPNDGSGCPEGEYCSPFGICAPDGQTCPTDDHGDPTVTCTQNSDCLACSPMNQVCDAGKCVACTASNTQHCLASDICLDGKCSPKCPTSCTSDNDCGQCGGPGNEAHACNGHQCAECSNTWPCAAGEQCQNGQCVPGCGIPGPIAGDCTVDEDCTYCGDPNDQTTEWDCKKAINDNHGKCTPAAAGCSDLGEGVAVLPEPWNQYTNTCSNDSDCNNVGIQLNVGELVRDAIGGDEIDLGFTDIEIHDAYVSYDMSKCASIELTDNISCGICVPCEVDADCQPISIDGVLLQLFQGEPLAQIAGALLLDLLFGNSNQHNINFYCQPLAAGYGACVPCANPLQACGQGGNNNNNNNGNCNHTACQQGGPLQTSCSNCAQTVCGFDPYCCNTAWDQICVDEAQQNCGSNACGGNGGSNCSHSECNAGNALTASCSTCATTVCGSDPFCCNNTWDSICVQEAADWCNGVCGNGGGSVCAHDECDAGGGLDPSCSSCASTVCGSDSYCCDTQWDAQCVGEAESWCGLNCGGGPQNFCAHDECMQGNALDEQCSDCAWSVCGYDPYCCNTSWDSTCVDEAANDSECNYCF